MGMISKNICFLAACMFNNDPRLIDRLINDFKINFNHINHAGDNCLTLGCRYNENLGMIKYLTKDLKMDTSHTNNGGDNCLTLACQHNANLEIIKYLTQDLSMDTSHTNNDGDNCLTLACYENTNLEIIKYLTQDLSMDISHTNNDGDNCLTLACHENTNLEVIKYLIQDLKMDIDHKVNDNSDCFTLACWENKNLEIAKYLIESTNAEIRFGDYVFVDQYQRWKEIIKLISKNFDRFSDMLFMGMGMGMAGFPQSYNDDLIEFLKTLNPLLLMDIPFIQWSGIMDPMDRRFKFNDYVKCVNELHSFIVSIPVPIYEQSHDSKLNPSPIHVLCIDFTEKSSLLFNYNGSEYHGHRDIVYESILCLKEIKDVANFDQLITLSGRMPKYAINLWLGSMYNKQFDIMNIKPCDLIPFLDHIDQYPTDFLTINTIECDLIRYLNTCTHFEEMIPCLKNISLRCRLKRLYLWIHNKEIALIA
jgi:NADH:ubiquinone oxidoreductase subunit E